ncbi:MAG: SHOCT domain-containing protein [Chloroflexi bacterium]|nr:SHOCT domain-containing protein [Chloroflexota bacterium]
MIGRGTRDTSTMAAPQRQSYASGEVTKEEFEEKKKDLL